MADPTPARRRALMLVVLGIALVGLLSMLLIGLLSGDDTDQIDPQNGELITSFRH